MRHYTVMAGPTPAQLHNPAMVWTLGPWENVADVAAEAEYRTAEGDPATATVQVTKVTTRSGQFTRVNLKVFTSDLVHIMGGEDFENVSILHIAGRSKDVVRGADLKVAVKAHRMGSRDPTTLLRLVGPPHFG